MKSWMKNCISSSKGDCKNNKRVRSSSTWLLTGVISASETLTGDLAIFLSDVLAVLNVKAILIESDHMASQRFHYEQVLQ